MHTRLDERTARRAKIWEEGGHSICLRIPDEPQKARRDDDHVINCSKLGGARRTSRLCA